MVHYQYDETLVQETVQNPYQTPENARIYFFMNSKKSLHKQNVRIMMVFDLSTYAPSK